MILRLPRREIEPAALGRQVVALIAVCRLPTRARQIEFFTAHVRLLPRVLLAATMPPAATTTCCRPPPPNCTTCANASSSTSPGHLASYLHAETNLIYEVVRGSGIV